MFNNWKSQLLQPSARNDAGRNPQSGAESDNSVEDAQVLRLRRMLADLRGPETCEGRSEMPATESISNGVAKAPENRREPVEAPPPARSDSALTALLNLLAEQREVAQALLEGCATLEERVKAEAMTTQAEREFTEATQKVNATTLLGTQSKELARAAAERRSTLAVSGKTWTNSWLRHTRKSKECKPKSYRQNSAYRRPGWRPRSVPLDSSNMKLGRGNAPPATVPQQRKNAKLPNSSWHTKQRASKPKRKPGALKSAPKPTHRSANKALPGSAKSRSLRFASPEPLRP